MTKNTANRGRKLGRRTLLRGLLGGAAVSLGLPLLEAMLNPNATALADESPLPKRFGVFYWGGGIVHNTWVPGSTGYNWALPDSLQPFSEMRDYLTLVTGTRHASTTPGHIPARGIALSSSHDMTQCSGDCVGVYRGQNHPEPSIDTIAAEAWAGSTPYKSLELSICQKGPYKNNSSWKAGGTTYNRHEPSPQAVWDRLFSNAQHGQSELLTTATAMEKSMLDAVMGHTKTLEKKLGAADRIRMEQHWQGLRTIEKRLQELEVGSCTAPDQPLQSDFGDGSSNEQKQAKSELMSQLLAQALACDLTRVFSYEWSATQSEAVYWEVGVSKEHHQLNHDAPTGTEMQAVTRFIMQNLAYLADQLRAQPLPGGGNLLDQTLILGTSEHGKAGSHKYDDHPFVLVGKAGGGLKAGMHHRVEGSNKDAPKVMLTALRAVDVPVAAIGDANSSSNRRVSTTLSAIEA